MREKIANEFAVGFENKPCEHCYARADKILALICEEIEKEGNPYPQLEPDLCGYNPTFLANADGFENCRDRILSLLQKTSMSSRKEVQ